MSLMDALQFPDQVHFLPWVGSAFHNQSRRILILGESHYSDRQEPRTLTRTLTQDYINGRWNHRFWTQVAQAVTGKPHWEINRPEFWSTIAFYNYVQCIVAESAGQ